MPRRPDPGPSEALAAPLSDVPWAPGIVAQALEVLIVHQDQTGIHRLDPLHADSLVVGLPVDRDPAGVVADVVRRYGLAPRVVHSTSWRTVDGHVVLTYLAVVASPGDSGPWLRSTPLRRADLARGSALAAPVSIAVDQVTEHALRHLAWLVRDDPAIAAALPDWTAALAGYVPEPFRNL
jgi:hypothetical protein